MTPSSIVFLVDVDNTLLDNDHIQQDLREHLSQHVGPDCQRKYWETLEELRSRDVNVIGEPFDVAVIGQRVAFITDNSGNIIEITEPGTGS